MRLFLVSTTRRDPNSNGVVFNKKTIYVPVQQTGCFTNCSDTELHSDSSAWTRSRRRRTDGSVPQFQPGGRKQQNKQTSRGSAGRKGSSIHTAAKRSLPVRANQCRTQTDSLFSLIHNHQLTSDSPPQRLKDDASVRHNEPHVFSRSKRLFDLLLCPEVHLSLVWFRSCTRESPQLEATP